MNQQKSTGTPTNKTGVTPIRNSVASIGKIAFLNFVVDSVSLAGSNSVVCTLPESFRPQHDVLIMAWIKYNDVDGMRPLLIKTNGDVATVIGSGTVTKIDMLNMPYPLL